MDQETLPITGVLDKLRQVLAKHNRAVLQAPPGAGKTTGVPPALLDAPWLGERKIVMLAPRRLAARAAAARMAGLFAEPVGRTVGYRVRGDQRVSAATRIEVVTEGILTRKLQNDPSLADTGLLIFDEFHERSLEADLGLALSLDMQEALNPGLRLLVMSATLDTGVLEAFLNTTAAIACQTRSHAVQTRYVGSHTPNNDLEAITRTVTAAAREAAGSMLVFLPGAGEIRRLAGRLEYAGLGPSWVVAPLYGRMSAAAQDLAIRPAPRGRYKIVLATDIAETSLTIEGIHVVVDSGLQRRPRFDVRSGLTRLVTLPISQASAEQRRGRAGRTGPGVCLRMWSQGAHHTLPPSHRPEILEADLASLALELALWGVVGPEKLRWLDPPSRDAFENARGLLRDLAALDAENRITDHGRRMVHLPLHPRLANMLLRAARQNRAAAACDLAAVLVEGDPLHFSGNRYQADVQLRCELLRAAGRKHAWHRPETFADQAVLRRVFRTAADLRRRLGVGKEQVKENIDIGTMLAWAYPDRIAMRRPDRRGRFVLASGRGAFVDPGDHLAAESFLVAVEMDGDRRNARIFQAAAYDADQLERQFGEQCEWQQRLDWDEQSGKVVAVRQYCFQNLVLRRLPLDDADPQAVLAVLLDGIRQAGLGCLPWTGKLRQWQQRVCFLNRFASDKHPWPDLSDQRLLADLHQWLAPFLAGVGSLRDLTGIDLAGALRTLLPRELQRRLDQWAPTHLTVPSGSRIPIDYSGEVPVLAVRLQEMFGLETTPSVARGRQALQLHLLSPAGRPVQITQDLAGFWRTSYHDVKREMKGRYPKHFWPEDPLAAPPTSRAKPRKN